MSFYPIEILKITLAYKQGHSNKEYHLLHVRRADGQAFLVKRWGKAGSWGQIDLEYGPSSKMLEVLSKAHRSKSGKGYVEERRSLKVANNAAELMSFLGGYYGNLGPEAISFLDPEIDVSGIREPLIGQKIEQQADGSFKRRETPTPAVPEVVKPKPNPYANDPLWGSF